MKWSWKLGTFAGIDVYVYATFLILVAWLVLLEWSQGHRGGAILSGVLFILALFACVILHEFGHALTARRFGIPTRDITLLPIGGISRMERIPDDPRQELWVALAGPAVSVAIAAALFAFLLATGVPAPLKRIATWAGASFVEQLMFANIVLAIFNLLPAFPMDGGRIFRAALARYMDYSRATQVAANVGQGMAFLFGALGLFTNPFLLFIAFFVWIGAAQESAAVQMKAALVGIPVGDVTVTEFSSLSPSDPLTRPVEIMLHGTQQDFPVLENDRLVGILPRKDLLDGLSRGGPNVLVSAVMRQDYSIISGREMLQAALDKLQNSDCRVLPVVDRGKLLGLFTLENLGEFLSVRSALTGKADKQRHNARHHLPTAV
jgi:Zn-dependent protease/predicted transcriptional regulator